MKTKSGKQKGKKLQKWTAAMIGFSLHKRVGPDEEIASREMGQAGADIRLVGDALCKFPFAVECKNCENWSVHQWIEQARQNVDARVHRGWLIVAKRNRNAPVVIMDAELFFELWGERNGESVCSTDQQPTTDRLATTEITGSTAEEGVL